MSKLPAAVVWIDDHCDHCRSTDVQGIQFGRERRCLCIDCVRAAAVLLELLPP